MKTAILTFLFIFSFQFIVISQNNCSDLPIGNLISDITPTQAKDTIEAYIDKDWFVILDVRTASEYNTMHLDQGVLLNFNSGVFSTEVAKFDRNKVYLIHCASGSRSAQAKVIMQNLGFYRVYNMTGGINSWNGSGYPTTTEVSAIADACVNEYSFEDIVVGNSETHTFKITNAANDLLTISDITSLDGTEFSTDFNIDTTLFGSFDYEFNITYTPLDGITDNQVFTVTTNGGVIDFILNGTALDYTGIVSSQDAPISVYNNSQTKQIKIRGNSNNDNSYTLFNASGIVCKTGKLKGESQIAYDGLSSGIYILRIASNNEVKSFKMMLD
ncbi:MAG: rhodanese-like domain-containing protein [Bacteroidales bacterium]|nr:rhodanese-like domain-containing protein [Bacteroidales bacterium]